MNTFLFNQFFFRDVRPHFNDFKIRGCCIKSRTRINFVQFEDQIDFLIDSIFYSQTEDVLDDVEIMSSISRESDERLGKFELRKKRIVSLTI